jgi:hypothetical protein
MANPSPSVHLPAYEYVELYNRSDKNIEMEGWTFSYGGTTKVFPPYLLPFGSFVLLVHPNAASDMAKYGATLPIIGAQAAISNTGQYLALRNNEGTMISWVDFTPDWYANDYKDDGGWSLELIDSGQPCSGAFNWKASIDRAGGTPGKENSVSAASTDMLSPVMQHIAVPDNHTIILYVSKSLENIAPKYAIEPPVPVSDAHIAGTHFDQLQITLQNPLQDGQWYDLSVAGDITDCAGYAVPPANFHFAVPQYADSLDVIINEILFQPLPDSYSFIELYNRSQKAIRVSDLQLAMRNGSGVLSTPVSLSDDPFLLLPGQYIVLSRNTDALIRQFNADNPECFLLMRGMPSLTRESGQIVLLNRSLRIVDEVHYSNSEHTDGLISTAGVSLERLNPDRNSLDPSNWHTAAQTTGFATPGKQNSQFVETTAAEPNSVTLRPEVFSPDNDGVDDVLNICYHFDIPALTADLIIFDSSGRRIRQLLRQKIAATEGVVTWDGFDDSHHKALTGVYIICFRAYNSQGFNKLFKIPCVLAGQRK